MNTIDKLFAFLLATLMIVGIAGCSNSQTTDENTEPEEVVEDIVPADTEDPVEDPVEEEPEVVTLTEEDLKDFVQFSNLFVQRREVVDEDVPDADAVITDTESEDISEEVDTSAETIAEDDVLETDAEPTEEVDEASDEMEEIVDPDPYGYLAAVKILNPVVVRDITYDDTLVDVHVVGDYELFYLAVVDEDAYNESLLSPVADIEDSEEPAVEEEAEDTSVENENVEVEDVADEADIETTDEPSAELPEPEHIIYGEIHKVVRVVEPEEYDEMLENGDIIEVVDGTAVLAPESEIVEVDIEDVEFTRPEGFEESADDASYIPSFKDDSGQEIDVPKPTPSGGGGNSGNNNSDNNFDDTGSENNTPPPTATEKPTTPTDKPQETETPKPQETTKPAETTKPTATPAPTATPHTHTWVEETIYHDEVSHEEPVYEERPVYGTESYYVVDTPAWSEVVGGGIKCLTCGKMYSSGDDWADNDPCGGGCTIVEGKTIYHDEIGHYETREVQTGTTQVQVGTTTVVDSPAWSETITKCSNCGAVK